MDKLTKIGLSALCGSLAVVASANAGSMTISGGATATYASNEKTTTGNPIGMDSGLTFGGSGELDNGTTFSVAITHADKNTFSSSSITMDMPSLGKVIIDQGAGGVGLDRIDDMMPTAWEETTGTSVGTGMVTIAGVSGSPSIEWTPTFMPEGVALNLAYTPHASGASNNDKGFSGADTGVGNGYDAVVTHTGVEGLTMFAGMSKINQEAGGSTHTGDKSEWGVGFTYAIGGATVGYQSTKTNLAAEDSSANFYDNSAYGVSFAVNDDLSISYGEHKSMKGANDGSANVEVTASSFQIAYSMGGASLKFAETSVDNATYSSTAANDFSGRLISLGLAF